MNKGKKKTFFRILILALVMAMSCLCVCVSTFEPAGKIVSAVTTSSSSYSSKDGNNLILMVEKVGVISTNDEMNYSSTQSKSSSYESFEMKLYSSNDESDTNTLDSIFIRDQSWDSETGDSNYYNRYYFTSIDDEKYVVANGEFVMLENQKDSNGFYYNSDLGAAYYEGSGSRTAVNMAQAIMVSFGQYFYDSSTGTVSLNSDPKEFAGIQQVNVVLYRNGVEVGSSDMNVLPGVRQNSTNTYQDFVYIIPQIDGNEGYYEFAFTYFYGSIQYSQTFSFYLLYENSYTGTITPENSTNSYTAQPTLSLSADALSTDSSNVYRYYLGTDSTNYPTLVYDYTKYKLSYTLVANGTTSTYNYTYSTTTAAGGSVTGSLVCSVTTSGVATTTTYIMDNYSASATNNLAIIMFTEMGEYSFSFEYIYSGYNVSNAPAMNLDIDGFSLGIHGFELKYSKANYSEAQMRYLTVSTNLNDGVDLIIPNGYKYGSAPSSDSLQVVYSLDASSTARVGAVVGSKDACVNLDLLSAAGSSAKYDNYITEISKAYLDYYKDKENTDTLTTTTDVTSWINNITYQKTNQGSLWLSTNDSFTLTKTSDTGDDEAGSFYLYSKSSKITFSTSDDTNYTTNATTIASYSNTTSFNSTGYYLVFIKVVADGESDYYQIFAFQYTTDTQSVNVNTAVSDSNGEITGSDGNKYSLGSVIGAGDYTNQNVIISWTEPDIFEREITVKYYSVTGQYYTRAQLLTTTGTTITNYTVLGSYISTNSGASFLIQLTSEGKSASYRMFTIDREQISGVNAYSVEALSASDGSIIYQMQTTTNGSYITITSAITDSLSTLYWNLKNSGAEITVSYTYTPFTKSSDVTVSEVYTSTSATWYSTNYILGTTTGNFSLSRVSSLGADVSYSDVLYNQGIYVFTLTDEAGNSCKYMLIIDNTEAYFKVTDSSNESEFHTGDAQTFSDDYIDITVSTHKAIQLFNTNLDTASLDEKTAELYSLIKALSSSTSAVTSATSLGYFSQTGSNLSNLASLFSTTSVDSKEYAFLIVANSSVTAYDSESKKDDNLSISTISNSANKIRMTYQASTSTSMIRYYYLLGANQTYTSAKNSNSYISIEINKDNSQGTAYYSNDLMTIDGIDTGLSNNSVYRLNTGSDYTNDLGVTEYGIEGAHATSDNYVAFTWVFGDFTIKSISYTFYSLDLTNGSSGSQYYFYKSSTANTTSLYLKDEYGNETYGSGVSLGTDGKTGFALINVSSSMTTAGLYVITRTYDDDQQDAVTQAKDNMIQTYYFIVDRNGIISSSGSYNGGNIHIGLLETETEYNTFSGTGYEKGTLYYVESGATTTTSVNYNVYLSTNKLPATVNVTSAKYFDGTNGSDYYSGRLTFTLYFVDKYNQLQTGNYKGTTLKLFEVSLEDMSDSTAITIQNGYYVLNLKQLINSNLQAFFINSESGTQNDTDWLCLAGDYVLVISDVVEGSTTKGEAGSHEKVIGFRIQYNTTLSAAPTTDVYSVSDASYSVADAYNFASSDGEKYTLITSEEFVKVELPEYDSSSKSAGVDVDYLVVTQNFDGNVTTYINYQYAHISGLYNLSAETKGVVEIDSTGAKTIYLDTLLRDSNNEIIVENLSKTLTYTITIRYRLSTDESTSKTQYMYAYYYYNANGKKVYYYEQTYTVTIDRVAPAENIENLIDLDNLVDYYTSDSENLFEDSYYESGAIYFVKQYSNYYSSSDSQDIYALRVTSQTEFLNDDVYMLYYRVISDPTQIELNLPVRNYTTYTSVSVNTVANAENYGAILPSSSLVGQYVEILELDVAGNVSQYVVFFDDYDDSTGYSSGNYQSLVVTFSVTSVDNSGYIQDANATISATAKATSSLTIFSIASLSKPTFNYSSYDKFYYFELLNAVTGESYSFKTDLTTDFTGTAVSDAIVTIIKTAGYGNYTLTIHSHYGAVAYTINYYDQSNQIELNVENLVYQSGNDYYINLWGANVTDSDTQIMYYAETITVTDPSGNEVVYTAEIDSNGDLIYTYSDGGETKTASRYITTTLGTYLIHAVDTLKKDYYLVFNTDGKEYYDIYFGSETNTANAYYYNNTYYAFTYANVYFDTSLYSVDISYALGSVASGTVQINSLNISDLADSTGVIYGSATILDFTNLSSGYIVVNPYFGTDYLGEKLEVTITLSSNNQQAEYNYTYNIVIDTTTYAVRLRDNSTSNEQTIEVDINADYSQKTTTTAISSGNMTLSWTKYTNDYFEYNYAIYELKEDGIFVETMLNDVNYYSISTGTDSLGIYNFVISIYTADGNYLGNKVYTFSVQPKSSYAYYVWNSNNISIMSANSSFTFGELISDELTTSSGATISAQLLAYNLIGSGASESDISISNNNDLYISTSALTLWVSSEQGFSYSSYKIAEVENDYTFTVYRIYNSSNVNIYIGVLIVSESSSIISGLTLNTVTATGSTSEVLNTASSFSFVRCGSTSTSYILTFSQTLSTANVITKKNNILMDVYYNNNFVKTVNATTSGFSFAIEGNGTYSFVFRDFAGNTHEFSVDSSMIDLTILREIPLTINGASVVDYAYFNGRVVVSLTSPAIYDLGSIRLTATLNGSAYSPSMSSYSYTFSGYGTYRVIVSATYGGEAISRTLVFTIINENEARSSIDFTNLNDYEITKVTNPNGKDVTLAFLSLISSTSTDGMLLTYDELFENSSALGVTSGKQSFTVTYLVSDGVYEDRQITFVFTMNDAVPTIESTVASGDSTTKGFTITYNAGIIYDQVGESYLYINDTLVCIISASSSSGISTYTISENTDGAGSYYVRLVSSSGNIITSFKVEVKEPLNTWAIIIIVVVTVLILAVVITIIVLRTRMRVR